MDNSVIIKGNKHGIVVVMDENIPFDELKEALAEKFRSASKFFDKANMAVSFEGRKISGKSSAARRFFRQPPGLYRSDKESDLHPSSESRRLLGCLQHGTRLVL